MNLQEGNNAITRTKKHPMNTYKSILTIFLTINCMLTNSQEFKERHIRKLENHGIIYKTEYSFSEQATKDLHQILHYDFKRRAKKTVGFSLLTVGMGGLVGGVLLMNQNSNNSGAPQSFILGVFCYAAGAAGVGTSIPLFVSAGKSKKNRDKLKLLYQSEATRNPFLIQSNL